MQPIDYTQGFQPVNIAEQFGSGFAVGSGIRNELQRREDENIARKRAEQQLIKEMGRQAQYERDVLGVFNDPKPQNIARLQITYPERIKQFQAGFETLDKARVADEQKFIGQTYAALRTNPAVAEKLLTDRIAALTTAGEDVTEETNALNLLKTDPKQALGYVGSMAALFLPKDQIDALTKLDENTRAEALAPSALAASEAKAATAQVEAAAAPQRTAAELSKIGADIGLTKAQTTKAILEGRKIGAETTAAILNLEAIKAGKLPPEKAFEQEEKLRKEYTARSAKYQDAKAQNSVIEASAADRSGAGDIALVTAFNKLLDPGSVVRETEFAKSQDTSGLLTRLSNAAQKLQSGSFLDDKQREDFKRLASKYYEAAQKKEAEDRKAIGTVVKNYNLNEQNVFGPPEAPAAPPPAPAVDIDALIRKYGGGQ